MSYNCEGTIIIPFEEFWDFVDKYIPEKDGVEHIYGVPKIGRHDISIPFAQNTDCNPVDQRIPPEFMKEWELINER